MFTGAVQSVQVLLQLVLFAFGLLSICQGATLRCALHLLGPIGMWRFTKLLLHVIVCYHGQSIEFFILNLWYFFDGNVQVFPANTVATALTYILWKITFLILTFHSPGSCFDYYHHERGS